MIERVTMSFESQSMMKTIGARINKVEKGMVSGSGGNLTVQKFGKANTKMELSMVHGSTGIILITNQLRKHI